MEFNIVTGVLIGVSALSIAAAVYTRSLYKSKKAEEISLDEKLKKYNDDIIVLDESLLKKSDELSRTKSKLDEAENKLNTTQVDLENTTSKLKSKQSELQHLIILENKGGVLKQDIENHQSTIKQLLLDIKLEKNKKTELMKEISVIKGEINLFSPIYDLVNVGFFKEPKYLFETSERFKEEILIVREKQKQLIQDKEAIIIPNEVAIISDAPSAKKALLGQSKIMLKAFNIEVDLLLASLKPSNLAKTLERIEKLATDIEKSAISLKCGFSQRYIQLKFKECELQYQFKLKQEDERAEQKAIKEQMREEQQAIRDFERALVKAQKEEQLYQNALEQARKEMELANEGERDSLASKIAMLEMKLKEAEENETRAKSMAEQTKRGHVYVISNIGSFGEDVYKIGMTRRLEPLDRVKELGDASVPFLFDVHAMIFSEDAPKLEKELHKIFRERRVNKVNNRKEFFNVSLSEIQSNVESHHGTVEFTKLAEAKEYRETLNIKSA